MRLLKVRLVGATLSLGRATSMGASNCLFCLYYAAFDIFNRLSPVRFFCPHSEKYYASKPSYKITKFPWGVGLCFASGFLLFSLCSVPSLTERCKSKTSFCLVMAADEVFTINNLLVITVFVFKADKFLQELAEWCDFILCEGFYGLNGVVTTKKSKRLILMRNITSMLFLLLLFYCTVLYFFFVSYDDTNLSFVRKITLIYSGCLQFYVMMELWKKFYVIGAVLTAMKKSLIRSKPSMKQIRAVFAIRAIQGSTMILTTFFLTLWILTTIVFLICNISTLLNYAELDIYVVVLLQSKALYCVAMNITLYYLHDRNLKEKVSTKKFIDL
ncbi:hypothetical protein Zmor_008190 [Zophobas morio]|uniref:Gustatory receptor n=1 Tax=Zophobas morio TaxID=2755281 RepID=A0AA38IYE8_9CUCU|nr:hypothetical protein Zmor_008190 [Zophobas morio]